VDPDLYQAAAGKAEWRRLQQLAHTFCTRTSAGCTFANEDLQLYCCTDWRIDAMTGCFVNLVRSWRPQSPRTLVLCARIAEAMERSMKRF
jgi:hypothetical protein